MNKALAKKLNKDTLRQTIARNIRHTRMSLVPRMTQEQVAAYFDPPMTRSAIAQWEIGDTLPDIDRLAILSKAFGVTIDSLVFGEDREHGAGEHLTPDALLLAKNYMTLDKRHRAVIFSLLQTIIE